MQATKIDYYKYHKKTKIRPVNKSGKTNIVLVLHHLGLCDSRALSGLKRILWGLM
jgi:hypothetical protein